MLMNNYLKYLFLFFILLIPYCCPSEASLVVRAPISIFFASSDDELTSSSGSSSEPSDELTSSSGSSSESSDELTSSSGSSSVSPDELAPSSGSYPPVVPSSASSSIAKSAKVKDITGYEVVFFNRVITTLRRDTVKFGAELRAEAAMEKIASVVDKGGPGTIELKPIKYGFDIRLDRVSVFRILEGDANPMLDQSLKEYALEAVDHLNDAVENYKRQKNLTFVKEAGLTILVAIIITFVVFFVMNFIRGFFEKSLEKWLKLLLENFSSSDFTDKYSVLFANYINKAILISYYVLASFVIYTDLTVILSSIPYTKPWASGLLKSIYGIFSSFYTEFIQLLPSLIVFVMIIASTKILVNLTVIFFNGVENNDIKFPWIDQYTVVPTKRITTAFLWIVGLGLAYPFIPGSDSDAFKGLSVVVGLMMSLGSSNIISQGISGIIIIYTKTLKNGDYIKVNDYEGEVISAGAFTVKIRTIAQEEVSIPNSLILSSSTVNYTSLKEKHGISLYTVVGLDYNVPWRQVNALLLEAARRTSSLMKGSKPFVWQSDMGDYYMEYTLVTWLDRPDIRRKIKSELYANIQDVFNENEVQIMTPRYLHLFKTGEKMISPKREWYSPPASLTDDPISAFGLYESDGGNIASEAFHGEGESNINEKVENDYNRKNTGKSKKTPR